MAVGHGKRIVGGEAIALLYQYGTDTEAEMANICANHRVEGDGLFTGIRGSQLR